MLSRLLTIGGEDRIIEGVGTVVEALEAWAEVAPNICVIDLCLADGSGLEVIAEIAQRSPATKIVLFSACLDHGSVFEAQQFEGVSVIDKQNLSELLDVVDAHLAA